MGHFWGYDKITVQQIFTLIDKEIIGSQRNRENAKMQKNRFQVIKNK